SAALTAQSKTWSTVTATAEHPESGPDKSYLAQQSPFFPQEFPKLDGGNAPQDGATKPSADTSYGPGPSLRPQTEGSWGRGTLPQPQPGFNPNANQSPNAGSGGLGQPQSPPAAGAPNDQSIQQQMARGLYPQSGAGLPPPRPPIPGAVPIMPAANQSGAPLMPGQTPMNYNQYRMMTPYPPHVRSRRKDMRRNTSAALTAQSKTWSTVTATAEHPESGPDKSYLAQQSPFFPQEFPKLDGGNAPQDAATKPSADTSYGPGPSLRPQTEGSWGRGTLPQPQPGFNPNANLSPNAGSGGSGQPQSPPAAGAPNDQSIQQQMARGLYPQSVAGLPPQRPPIPGAVPIMPAANQSGAPLMPGQTPMNYNQYRMMTPYPPHMAYPRGTYPGGPFPPQGYAPQPPPHGHMNPRQPYFPDARVGQRPDDESGGRPARPAPPIITDKDLKGFDDILENDKGLQKGWAAANTEVDYNAKIVFSDDEDSQPMKESANYGEMRSNSDKQKDWERRDRDYDRGDERPKSYRSAQQQQQWQQQQHPHQQHMPANARVNNFDNQSQPQQQQPQHGSQQGYPQRQQIHSNYPHSRHNRSDHTMADDDEMWRQRSQQQTDEMAAAVIRARQRRLDEEKRMERSRQAAHEKLRILEEKVVDKDDVSSRHSSESKDDKLSSSRDPRGDGRSNYTNSFAATKQYPKNVPPRFQKQAEMLRQTQGSGPPTGAGQPPYDQRFTHSSNRLPSESESREGRNLVNSSQANSKAPAMADNSRSNSQISSGHESYDSERERRTPDYESKERRPHRTSGSDSNNWRAAQTQRSPLAESKDSSQSPSARPVDDTDNNQNLHRDVPKRANEESEYLLQKSSSEVRDNKPKDETIESKESFSEKRVLVERQESSQSSHSDKRSTSSKEDRFGKRYERLDWAAECDNMSPIGGSYGQRREHNRHRPVPITQKQFESITEPIKKNFTPIKKTSNTSVTSSYSEDSKEGSVDKTKDTLRKSETPPLNTTAAYNADNLTARTSSSDVSKVQTIREETRGESLGSKKEKDSDRQYDRAVDREKDYMKKESIKDDRNVRKERSNSSRYETSRESYSGRGARYPTTTGPAFRGTGTGRGREYRRSPRSGDKPSYNESKGTLSPGTSRNKTNKSRRKSNSDESCVSEDINKTKESTKAEIEKSIPVTITDSKDTKHEEEKEKSVTPDTVMSGSASSVVPNQRNDISRRGRGLVPFKNSSTRGMPRAYGPSNYGPPPSRAAFGDGSVHKSESNKNYDQNRNERNESRNSNQMRNTFKSAADEMNYSSHMNSQSNQYQDNNRNSISNARKSGAPGSRGTASANTPSNNNRAEQLPPRFQKRNNRPSQGRGGRRSERSGSGNQYDDGANEEWETASESSDIGDRNDRKAKKNSSSDQQKTDSRSHNRKSDNRRGGDYTDRRGQHVNSSGNQSSGYRDGRGGRNRNQGNGVLTTRSPNTNQQRNGTISGSNINDNITVCALSEVTLDNPNAVEEALSDIKNRNKSSDLIDDQNNSETEDGFQTVSYKKRNRVNQGNDSKKFKQELSPKSKATVRTRQSKLAPRFAKQKENNSRLKTITDEAFTSTAKISEDLKSLSIDNKSSESVVKSPKEKVEISTQIKTVPNAWSRPLSHCSQTTASNTTITTTTKTTTQTSSSKVQDIHALSVSSKSSSFDQHDSGIDADQPPSTASSQRSSPSNDDNKLITTTAKVTNPTETRTDIVTDIDAAKPMCTVIFENTRYKEENKVLAKIAPAKSPTAKEMFVATTAVNNVVTEASRPNPPIAAPKKTDSVLIDEFALNEKTQTPNVAKVVGMQRTSVLPTESDLNVKIASTRKVWENPSVPSTIDSTNENAKNALLKSFDANKMISSESHTSDVHNIVKVSEPTATKVHYSTVEPINPPNKSKTPVMTYSTPTPNQMSQNQSYVSSHQSQPSLMSSQQILLNTISSPPLVESMRPVSGVQQSFQVHTMAQNPAISTPPTMLYNTHVGAHNVYQSFGPQMDSLHQTQLPPVMAQFGAQHNASHYGQHLLQQHQQNQLNQANIFMTHQLTQPSASEQFKQLNAVAHHQSHQQSLAAKALPINQFVHQNTSNLHQTLANSGSWTAATPHNQTNTQTANYYQQSNTLNNVLQAHQQHFAYQSQPSMGLMSAQNSQATAAALAVQQSYRATQLPMARTSAVDSMATNSMAANLRSMFAGNIINDMKIGNSVNQTVGQNANNRTSFAYNQSSQSLQQIQQQHQQMFAANQKFTGRAILPIYAQQMLSQSAAIPGRPNSTSMLTSNVSSNNSYTTPIQRPKVNRNNQSYVKNTHPTHYQNQYQTQPQQQLPQQLPPQPQQPTIAQVNAAQQAKMRQEAVRQTQSFFAQSSLPTTKGESPLEAQTGAPEVSVDTVIADNTTPALNDNTMNTIEKND
ncbi:unnamed protein product, partial [Oppiella nova]